MPAYDYLALDADGRRQRGQLEGENIRQLREQLRARGLTPLALEEVSARRKRAGAGRGRIGAGELALFVRQLATLLQSGLPLDEALQALAEQSETPRMRGRLENLREQVREGRSLSESMTACQVFDPLTRAMVAAGEQSRSLPRVLERLAEHAETRQALQRRVLVAMIYPTILILVSLLVTAGLLVFVVPEVTRIFTEAGQTLPLATRLLLAASALIKDYGLWLLPLGGMLFIVARQLLAHESNRLRLQSLMLRLPLIGRLLREVEATRLARTLGGLLESGTPMLEAMHIGARAQATLLMQRAVEQARERVREGAPLHRALGASGLLPAILLHMIANGERGGNLDQMLIGAANGLERGIDARITLLLGLLEPLIILLMGSMVMFIVIAILLPIFDMNSLV